MTPTEFMQRLKESKIVCFCPEDCPTCKNHNNCGTEKDIQEAVKIAAKSIADDIDNHIIHSFLERGK